MHKQDIFNDVFIKSYSVLTLYSAPPDVLQKINNDNSLTEYISKNSDYLEIENPAIEKLLSCFSLLGVSFKQLIYRQSYDLDLFQGVYKNSLYQITFSNISLLLRVIYHVTAETDIQQKNFTVITQQKDSPLYLYIMENFPLYISELLETCDTLADEEESVCFILNNGHITQEQGTAYIEKSETVITNITSIEDTHLWQFLIHKKCVSRSVGNILSYFTAMGEYYDDALLSFVNDVTEPLDFSTYPNTKILQFFSEATVRCNDLNNQAYSLILEHLEVDCSEHLPYNMAKEKIDILIDLKKVTMTKDALRAIRKQYPESLKHFILSNIAEYVALISHPSFYKTTEMLDILDSSVQDEYKLQLLQFENYSIQIQGKSYSDAVLIHILTNNLDFDELQYVLDLYPKASPAVQQAIQNITVEQNHRITRNTEYHLPEKLYFDLVKSEDISIEIKIDSFIKALPNLDPDQCKASLKLLSLSEFIDIFSNKRLKFEKNYINEQILAIFQEKGWIFSYSQNENGMLKISKPNYE